MHATYRHDLKIYASDEGRVMKTAAAFTKGLLELEGNLTPILASLVTVEEKNRQMLDKGGNDEIKDDMDRCKEHMAQLLQSDADMSTDLIDKVAPGCPIAVKKALLKVNNPLKCLRRMHELVGSLCAQLDTLGHKHALVAAAQEKLAAVSLVNGSSTNSPLAPTTPTEGTTPRKRTSSRCLLDVMADSNERLSPRLSPPSPHPHPGPPQAVAKWTMRG